MGLLEGITGLLKEGAKLADDFITTEEEKFEQMLKKEQLNLEREKTYLQDTQSARQMQIEALKQDDRFSKRFIYYFAILWTIIGASYIIGITFFEIPDKNVRFADTTLGFILGTIISQIIAFFYGSSLGSKSKEEALKKISK